MIIAITGATGMVGTELVPALERDGHLVRRIVRGTIRDADHEISWDPAAGKIDAAELNGIDADRPSWRVKTLPVIAGARISSRRFSRAASRGRGCCAVRWPSWR